MKRIFSIALLFVFLFQFVGYYFVYLGLRHQARTEMISRLDARQYSSEETITLKIPFSLPYWMDSKDYERVDGEFQHEGQFYKLVEQKLEQDTLYVVCIRDNHEKKLFDTMSDYAKLANDLPTSSHQTLKLLSGLMKDYVPSFQLEIALSLGWSQPCSFADPSYSLLSQSFPVSSPPPEALC
ncbi:hypothetical protein [Chryseolinea lacunae]|uniref:Uncharacterized protein n=1 Tax=Chryseolinea lacunae TaxID=2801331 RepID=A0ABS1KW47_9BACT|nr:hypothetical protein [Chryseolinea lacunae]MBL0743477.1 hypothetical protein [Chryseolinea lacunae]